jgi:hypothetical protein
MNLKCRPKHAVTEQKLEIYNTCCVSDSSDILACLNIFSVRRKKQRSTGVSITQSSYGNEISVLENGVLRIFGLKRVEVAGGWRKLH